MLIDILIGLLCISLTPVAIAGLLMSLWFIFMIVLALMGAIGVFIDAIRGK